MVIKLRLTKEEDERRQKIVLKIFEKSSPLLTLGDIKKSTGWDQRTIRNYLDELLEDKKIAIYNQYSTTVLYRLTKRKDLKFKLYKLKK